MKNQVVLTRIDGTEITTADLKTRKKRWTKDDWTLLIMASLSLVFLAVFAYAP